MPDRCMFDKTRQLTTTQNTHDYGTHYPQINTRNCLWQTKVYIPCEQMQCLKWIRLSQLHYIT